MVLVVSHFLDVHVLEQSVICSNNVVRLELDLSSILLHAPCSRILQPLITLWEEV